MRNASPARRALVVGLILALVLPVGAGFFSSIASADIGSEGCYDDVAVAVLSPWSISTVAYDNYKDPCWETTAVSNEELTDLTDNQTYEKVITVIDTRSNEERLIETLLTNPEFSKEPVRQRAELEFADAYINNSTETESINAGRNAVKDEYNVRLKGLALRYNRDARNARNAYSRLDSVNATSHMHVYVNGTELDTSTGITFSVPTDQNDTVNGTTYTLPNTDTVRIATVTVGSTSYDFRQDDLAITMTDPATGGDEAPILGRDLSLENGADGYDPSSDGYTPSTADIVVAADGSGDYTNPTDALAAVTDGDVVFVKSGTYFLNTKSSAITNISVTIVGDDATLKGSGPAAGEYAFNLQGNNITVSGFTLVDYDTGFSYNADSGMVSHITTSNVQEMWDYGTNSQMRDWVITDGAITYEGTGSLSGPPTASEKDSWNIYDYQFDSFTSAMIVEQKADRDEILAAFGDSTAGYFHDVWNKLATDTLSITDILTYEQMFGQSFSEEDIGSRAWLDAQYMQAGMSSHDLQSTVIVEVQANSTVFAGAQKSGATTLTTAKTYEGHLWTMNPPAGSWETNKTYNTTTLGGPLYVTFYQQRETLNSDGSISVEMVPATVAVDGEFRLNEMINSSGSSVTTIDHAEAASADPYNASKYDQKIQTLNNRINTLNEEIQDDGGITEPSGACIVNLPLIGCIESLSMSLFGGVVVLVGVYAFVTKGVPGILAALLGR